MNLSDDLKEKTLKEVPEDVPEFDKHFWITRVLDEMYEEVKHEYEGKPQDEKEKKQKKKQPELKPENKKKEATKKQLWALHCITKLNTKDLDITREQASDLISRAKEGEDISDEGLLH